MAQLSHLLLFDPDPNGLDALTYGFEREGIKVTGTSDLARARLLIQQGGSASLLIVNLGQAEKSTVDLLRAASMSPGTRNLPCVAIGRETQRAAALAAGAFIFLSVPLFLRDIIGACRMVAAASLPGSRPSSEAELSLNLFEMGGVYFLVRAMAATGRSALVEVRRGPSRGELRFIQGSLASADVGSVQGLPALHRMLLWEDATLQFKFKNVVRRGAQLSMKSNELLEECDRFLRDFSHEARELGFAGTVYTADLDRMQPSAALPSEVVPVLKLFDGQRNLAQLLEESPFRIFDTLKIVRRFVTDGAIKTKASMPIPVVDVAVGMVGPSALDAWLQRKAPAFGPEVGGAPSATSTQNGVSQAPAGGVAAAAHRPDGPVQIVSPFVVTDRGTTGAGTHLNKPIGASAKKRPIPKKSANQLDLPRNSAPTQAPSAPKLTPNNTKEDAITPPPVIRLNDVPTRPNAAVARGEIQISPSIPRTHETVPPAGLLSVMVEPSVVVLPTVLPTVLPAPLPMASTARLPLTAQAAPPSVVLAPMSVILDPSIATPLATPAVSPPPRKSEPHVRSVSDNFNAIEADFFDREADLYKRESVESFDDLDGSNGGSRKR